MFWVALISLVLALLPAAMVWKNLQLFRPAPDLDSDDLDSDQDESSHSLSIVIPARNEESSIRASLESILANRVVPMEVIVVDDHSEDRTSEIVKEFANKDPRVRLVASPALPEKWNGKQHACWQGAMKSRYPWLLFLDADVRLNSHAIERIVAMQRSSRAELLSGFPFQETGTLSEKTLIPLMHFVLLGYLPIERMRMSKEVGFAAGCGQMFLANRSAYDSSGGHSAIASSRHDGIKLPRAFRKAGFATDVFDASDLAKVRMYTNTKQVLRGLLKNATEGIANWKLILPFTLLLGLGVVAPPLLLLFGLIQGASWWMLAVSALATIVVFVPRYLCARAFHQSWIGVVLHPISVACFLMIQWVAIASQTAGIQVRWRGRM